MSSEMAIRVDNLSKCYHIYEKPRDRLLQMIAGHRRQYYKEFWALSGVSFEIEKGSTVGIIGRNGSGKSTLLQMICGTVSPTKGEVRVNGRVAALLELGAGFNGEFTGRENVMLNAAILGFPREEMMSRMESVLAFSELGEFLDQPVKTYSSGMYARLAFSIAIHVDPEILIVDEALAVGDARFVSKCMRRIKDIQEQGSTILFVSHDVGSVRALCKQAIWLDKGCMVDIGDVFPVTGRYMEYMFKDEESEDTSLRDAIVAIQGGHGDRMVATAGESVEAKDFADGSEELVDSRPVTHWGSHKGVILGASVKDGRGQRQDVLAWGKEVEVVIDLLVPPEIDRDHLSVAFSIKDLKGTDLIVSTTHDFEQIAMPQTDRFSVSFRFTNPLTTGKYLLVAAVENRQQHDIHYYEYVEGAHYFSSLSEERFFGIFQPQIAQCVMVK